MRFLRRHDLSQRTGCNIETIRYYEKIGLMPEPPRNARNYRCYDEGHVERLRFIMRARALGFRLDDVRELLSLVDGGMQTCAEVRARARRQIGIVRERIRDLRRMEAVLAETVSRCSGDEVPDCAVIDALFGLGEEGVPAGPGN